jgi:phosphate acetyltransferase
VGGIILTGGLRPHKKIIEIIRHSGIPVLLSKENTYRVASKLHDLVVKIRVGDRDKIETARALIEEYVDLDRVFERLD